MTETTTTTTREVKILSARQCAELASELFRDVVPEWPDGDVDTNASIPAEHITIAPFDFIVAHVWPGDAYRTIVVPVNAHGEHDGIETLLPRDRLRLGQFRKLALVGLTDRPAPARTWLQRKLSPQPPVPLSSILFYDVIDRERGTYLNFDDAVHIVERVGRLPFLTHVLRGSFRAYDGSMNPKYKPTWTGQGQPQQVAMDVNNWVRGRLVERFDLLEFLLRGSDESCDDTGRRRIYRICRDDWEQP